MDDAAMYGQYGHMADGTHKTVEDDVITITEFDPSGKYFVTGDKGGRIVLFRRNDEYKEGSLDDGEKKQEADEEDRFQSPSLEWNAVYQFVSHQLSVLL